MAATVMDGAVQIAAEAWEVVRLAPAWLLLLSGISILLFAFISVRPSQLQLRRGYHPSIEVGPGLTYLPPLQLYLTLHLIAPLPRHPHPSEKTYITTLPSGGVTTPQPLACWHDDWLAHRASSAAGAESKDTGHIEPATLAMSVVIPAYNEEARLETMLEEAVSYLDATYGRASSPTSPSTKSTKSKTSKSTTTTAEPTGYEILLINDGSTDSTISTALRFSHAHSLHSTLRIISLHRNRGKGGAVTHGLRHVRGTHAVFADADGASRFRDLGALVAGAELVKDSGGRAVAVGSRAHLVGSEAVVKRSFVRNALMHSFHLLLRLLTPPATSRIRDTQCGFKLFTRAALPHIIPYMHAEGWIFDVEMLMLAESAPVCIPEEKHEGGKIGGAVRGVRVAEVPIAWQEVGGSKLNVLWDSIGMAFGLAVLRASWALGVYRRR
jgi:dolichyl-phosphate beta-glucosyltransferase